MPSFRQFLDFLQRLETSFCTIFDIMYSMFGLFFSLETPQKDQKILTSSIFTKSKIENMNPNAKISD